MAFLLARLEQPLMQVAGKLGQQKHLNAVRDGVVGALPLVLIGSLFLLLGQPPLGTAPVPDGGLPKPWTIEWYMAIRVWGLSAPLKASVYPALFLLLLILAAGIGLMRRAARTIASLMPRLLAMAAILAAAGALALWALDAWLPALAAAAVAGPWLEPGQPLFLLFLTVFRVLVGLIGIYVAFGTAHSLAKRYSLDSLSAGLLAAAALLLCNGLNPDKTLGIANLGSGGLFLAIILGLLVPEAQRIARDRKLEITMPEGVPPAVGRSFSALIPGLLVLAPIWLLVHILGVNLFELINLVLTAPVQALSQGGASLYLVLLAIILIDSLLWLLGVHAVAILAPMAAVWTLNMTTNTDVVAGGGVPLLLNTREALQFFIWIGGSGATIALPWLLLRARAAGLRAIAKVGLVPALFNVNEPLIFGVPVMMNPTLALPFIVAPIVTMTLTVSAVHLGLVPVPSLIVPWTLPGPVGAFLATRGAWSAALLSLVNIAVAALIYWPFVRMLDTRMAATEERAEAANAEPVAAGA